MKRMNRRWSAFTMNDVQTLADQVKPEQYASNFLAEGEYMPPFSEKLTGRTVVIDTEGNGTFQYTFQRMHDVMWNKDNEEAREEYVDVLELPDEKDIYLVQMYCHGSVPPTAHTLVLDFQTGLATICIAQAGNPENAREIQRAFWFGIMSGYDDPGYRHEFTEDLVGTAIYWTYHEEKNVRLKHIYTAPQYYTYQMNGPDNTCWVASNPADYLKINDHVYVFSFIEERQAGTQGFFLINMKTLHDVGSFFGIQAHGMECCMVGAKGELSSPFAFEWCEKRKTK